MKKMVAIFLVLVACLSICACSGSSSVVYKLGDTVETDVLSLTLNNAELAIKLDASGWSDGSLSESYFTADEYNPKTDSGLAYVAAKGHTYVVIEYKATNLDRSSIEFDGSFNDTFITVEYNNKKYEKDIVYGCESINGYEWSRYESSNVLLLAGEEGYYRCYMDIPTDANNLTDDFGLTFHLPKSSGGTEKFKFSITNQARQNVSEKEMSVEEAAYLFTEKEGLDFFVKHMNEYTVLTGEEILRSICNGKSWKVTIKSSDSSSWSGEFNFEEDHYIKETIENIGSGYFNNRTWEINENKIVLSDKHICEVRKVNDGIYLFVENGNPYMILN